MIAGRIACRVLLLAVIALACAACGAATPSTPSAPRPLSKRVYVERLNAAQESAPAVFADISQATRNPRRAAPHLAAIDALIAEVAALRPPKVWISEHATLLRSLRQMRAAIDVLSRAPASRTAIITTQVGRYEAARTRYEAAIRAINRSR